MKMLFISIILIDRNHNFKKNILKDVIFKFIYLYRIDFVIHKAKYSLKISSVNKSKIKIKGVLTYFYYKKKIFYLF